MSEEWIASTEKLPEKPTSGRAMTNDSLVSIQRPASTSNGSALPARHRSRGKHEPTSANLRHRWRHRAEVFTHGFESPVPGLALARVEEVAWKTSRHNEVKAGLYWPVDYVAGKKYPIVIQTHGWSPDRFWIDGPWTTAFAAQALAGKGFFVLQVPDPDSHLVDTPKEVPAAMAIYDGAIDLLDRKGLIDRDRIGITGFSRTIMYVTYTLIHSRHHFAAADITDGVDYGYLQYMEISNFYPTLADEMDRLNGAPPFGKGLLKWVKVSPAFLMDKIETPLRIQTL